MMVSFAQAIDFSFFTHSPHMLKSPPAYSTGLSDGGQGNAHHHFPML
ncbi:MAG: hypothetical protein HY966_00640 [Ignavibacteriales bacterium]|nr:hypothetical protein [Ignavibacteriales bacterium]